MFTYLCRPSLQGADAALQASQLSLSVPGLRPVLSRQKTGQTNFQTGFASCDPASLVWGFPSVYFRPGVAQTVSGVWWWLCASRPHAGPVCCGGNIYYDLLPHYYCDWDAAPRLDPKSTFQFQFLKPFLLMKVSIGNWNSVTGLPIFGIVQNL